MTLVDAHLGRSLTRGPLTLFPVFAGRGTHDPGYVLAPDVVQVGELDGGAEVGRLAVLNAGDLPALVLEGDLLLGGQQDRVAGRSAVVGAHRSLELEVFCSEAGRWDASSQTHRPTGGRAPAEVRAALAADQGEVWRRVDRYGQRFGAGPTSALRDAPRAAPSTRRRRSSTGCSPCSASAASWPASAGNRCSSRSSTAPRSSPGSGGRCSPPSPSTPWAQRPSPRPDAGPGASWNAC